MTRNLLAVAAALGVVGLPATMSAQPASSAADAPSFSKDVAPIFYEHCVMCHRPGEIAPMSLLTYRAARPYARAIAMRVSRGTMPPWHADPTHGEFLNDRRLTDTQKDTILKWVSAGAPEGNPADLPPEPHFPDGWAIGEPDLVVSLPEDYPIPADGTIDYKYFEVPTNLTEDKWIQAYQVRPGTPAVVHHVIVYARTPRAPEQPEAGEPARRRSGERGEAPFTFAPGMDLPEEVRVRQARQTTPNDRPAPEGGMDLFIGGFAPGQGVRVFQEGTAVRLPAKSSLIFQMHYTANGEVATDRSKIGLVFAKEPPTHELIVAALINANFTLPAGSSDTRVDAEMTINRDLTLWSLLPHTHVRGRRWEIEATFPDGRRERA